MSTQDTQFRDDVADYVQLLTTNLLGSYAEASVINQEVPIEASLAGALTNILSSTDSSARKKILDAANIQQISLNTRSSFVGMYRLYSGLPFEV